MKTFEVHFKGFKLIQAETLRDANETMETKYPELETTDFYDDDEEKNNEVIGHCEVSGLSIFEGDDFSSDKEGCMWLNKELAK